jgi:hypothetical protein
LSLVRGSVGVGLMRVGVAALGTGPRPLRSVETDGVLCPVPVAGPAVTVAAVRTEDALGGWVTLAEFAAFGGVRSLPAVCWAGL